MKMTKKDWNDLGKVGIVLGIVASIIAIFRGLDQGGAGVARR